MIDRNTSNKIYNKIIIHLIDQEHEVNLKIYELIRCCKFSDDLYGIEMLSKSIANDCVLVVYLHENWVMYANKKFAFNRGIVFDMDMIKDWLGKVPRRIIESHMYYWDPEISPKKSLFHNTCVIKTGIGNAYPSDVRTIH